MNILQAIKDEELFKPFLDDQLKTWANWFTFLRCVYGLRVAKPSSRALIHQCTGRNSIQDGGFDTVLALTGRRSGKSRIAALIGAFEATLAGREKHLSTGEQGIVAICSPTKKQSDNVKRYLRSIFNVPLLHAQIVRETREGFELQNGNRIEILAGDFRTVRGFTLLAAIVDEAAFFGHEAESKVKSDTELVRAIKPSLATVGGKLIAISSPYSRKGWCFKQYDKHHGEDTSPVLVWNAPSRTMNPTLPQTVIDDALADDLQAAKSEYLAEFRDDVSAFIPRSVVESVVAKGIQLRPFNYRTRYVAFCDVSGGRGDDAALAIAHREGKRVIVDLVRRWHPPFNPRVIVKEMAKQLGEYNVHRVMGDNYAAEFTSSAFKENGIAYTKSPKPKSAFYLELLPRLCSGEVELVDDDHLIDQLASLERRTRSGGKDSIDHPPGGHDDSANAVAGVCEVAISKRRKAGTF